MTFSKEKINLTVLMLLLMFYVILELDFYNKSFIVLLMFLINGMFSWMNILADSRFVSMNKFFWYFQFIFMFLAPLCNYCSNYFPWQYFISDYYLLKGTVLVFIWNIVYYFSYYSNTSMKSNDINKMINFMLQEKVYTNKYKIIVIVVAIISFGIVVRTVGFEGLFFFSERGEIFKDSTLMHLYIKLLSSLVTVCAAIYVRSFIRSKNGIEFSCMCLLMTLSFCVFSPTGSARQWFFGNFCGLILMLLIQNKKSRIFDYIILMGSLFVFPIMTVFKNSSSDNINQKLVSMLADFSIVSALNNVNFDAFTLIPRVIDYTERYGYEYGNQIIGTVLFFIPRSIWDSKPLVSSILVVGRQNADFINLSFPLQAEAYLDFGILGIILFSILYGKFNKLIDSIFWKQVDKRRNNIINIVYPFLCMDTFILNRGPLQPEYILIMVFIVPAILVCCFAKNR